MCKWFERFSFLAFIAFAVLCFAHSASALDIAWRYAGPSNPAFNNPKDACNWGATSGVYFAAGTYASGTNGTVNPGQSPCIGVKANGTTAGIDYAYKEGTTCPAGSTYSSTTGACNQSCPATGQTNNYAGQCVCPTGASPTFGDLWQRLNGGSTLACRTPAEECAVRAGVSRESTWPQTAIEGCVVSCATNTGANKAIYPYVCTYNGQAVGGATPSALNSGEGTPISPDPIAPEIPPGCTTPATGSCGGASYGFVNGKAVCASTSSSCAPGAGGAPAGGAPIANGAPAGTTVETETKSTVTNSNGTTTTTTVHTTIGGTGTGGTGSGSGTGTGDGEDGTGGGECDPTASDYVQCLAGEQSEYADFGQGESTRDSVGGDFYSGLQETGIGQLAGSISGGLPSGTCPIVQFEMFNRSYVMDFWCTVYDANAGVLSTVARAGWVLMGLVIILGA